MPRFQLIIYDVFLWLYMRELSNLPHNLTCFAACICRWYGNGFPYLVLLRSRNSGRLSFDQVAWQLHQLVPVIGPAPPLIDVINFCFQ